MNKMTQEEKELAEHLLKLGCPLDFVGGYRDLPARLTWRQIPTAGANRIFDLAEEGSGLVLDMRFSSAMNLPFRVRQLMVKAPWADLDISLLPHPSVHGPECTYYEFSGEGLSFDKTQVLNDFLSGGRALNPGDETSGLLLATLPTAIPHNYPEHARAELQLSIVDTRGNPFTVPFQLCMDRSAAVARERRKATAKSRFKKGRAADAA